MFLLCCTDCPFMFLLIVFYRLSIYVSFVIYRMSVYVCVNCVLQGVRKCSC
jgi:hypothetical protein